MADIPILLLALISAYFLGSIPFGVIVGKRVKGVDVREHGSRNTGATNVFRVVGKGWGIAVLILDALKGALAVYLAGRLLRDAGFHWTVLAGLAAILGHSFSIWLGFRGGKGVATSLGVFLALAFLPTLLTFLIWTVLFIATHIISISSLGAAVAFPLVLTWLLHEDPRFPILLAVSCLLGSFIFYTHRANIQRLMRGEEKKLF